MSDGWVKLWRQSIDSQVFKSRELWQLWCYCLIRASYKERWVTVDMGRATTEVKLMPGQLIFGQKSAGEELGMKPRTVYDRMRRLKMMGNLHIEPATHYSIVSICNWELYQQDEIANHQPNRQPTANHPPTIRQPSATYKKVKKVKKEKNEEKTTCPEPKKASAAGPPVMTFATNGPIKEFHLMQDKVDEWQSCYPTMDVLGELRRARQWLLDSPVRKKTAKGMTKYLGAWLAHTNDYSRSGRQQDGPQEPTPAIPADQLPGVKP